MPVIVQVNILLLWVLNACRVSTSNEMSDPWIYSRRCVPQYFIWTTVIHRRRPNCKDRMIFIQCSIIKQGLMLSHPIV
jgi:hypothetical protein